MRWPTTGRSSPPWGRWPSSAPSRASCAPPGWRCASISWSTTPRASIRGRRRALAGDPDKLAFYRTFPDRGEPDAYERTLPDVFPDTAPGSFSWVGELDRWVWTTFNPYQWDLDYTNPAVFRAMAEIMLALANVGVDVMRLDAVPFLWKRIGTELPEPARGAPAAAGLRAR